MKEFVEKLIERLEEKRMEYFLTMANTGDEKLDFVYENIGDLIDSITVIVNILAEEFGGDINVGSKDEKAEQIADDLSKVLKEAKSMGCKEVKSFHHIPLENVEIVINALRAYNQDSTEKKQGWILCSERLPKPGKRYLVTAVWKEKDFEKQSVYIFVYGSDGLWHSYNYEPVSHCEVIAWMPLPEPYKPKEKPKFSNEELDRIMDKILDNQDLDKVKQEHKTRIEHIRSMSVEELADAILERSEISTAIDLCQNFCGECEYIPESECRKCLIKYLNSPVEQKKTIPTDHFKERFNKVI